MPASRRRSVWARAMVFALLSLFGEGCASVRVGPVAGQEVVFFPTLASVSGNDPWSLTIQGRIYKPAAQHAGREAFIGIIAPIVGVAPGDEAQFQLFRERARYFLSDSEAERLVSINLGGETIALAPSDAAGFFSATIPLSQARAAQLATAGVIAFESAATAANPARFAGRVTLVPEEGLTVISDMDDTIKDTKILIPKEKVANTFLRPFAAVGGMPELYRSWQDAFGPDIHFHIVSAGPWQLNEPLRKFTDDAKFPPFTWTMRSVDIGNVAVLIRELTADPYEFKLREIRALMSRMKKRHVVLVGDSGEKDPEVYAQIAAEFPDRVDAVYIHKLQDHSDRSYPALFPRELAAKLCLFVEPKDIPPLTPATVRSAPCKSRN